MKGHRILLLANLLLLLPVPVRAADRPNVVIFLADDSGWGDYSINGNTNLRTPNIDSEFPRTPLSARDGVAHGGVKRSAGAPNCSYFVNWTNFDDEVTWDISVATAGDYEVEILYTCPPADAGSTIALEFNGHRVTGTVTPGWDPPLYTNQDTVTRPRGESQMKEFRPLNLGVMRLERGRGLLTLRALQMAGKNVMDVRQVNLTLRK